MKFRKKRYSEIKKEARQRLLRRTELPPELIKAGKFLSPKAFRVYCILKWFNPCFPSYAQLRIYTGYGKEALCNALEEVELKGMVKRSSGKAHRENNLYSITNTAEWDLFKTPLSPSAKHKAARRKKELARLLFTFKVWFDSRTKIGSIIEPVSRSIIEHELDQSQSRLNNQGGQGKKGALPGNIQKELDLIKSGRASEVAIR